MTRIMTLICVLAVLMISEGTVKVYLPGCAVKKFDKEILYTLSNFGYLPYGETIIGKVEEPEDKELCSVDASKTNKQDINMQRIFLVRRGSCKFTEKVINAQKMGADVVLIYDNNTSSAPSVIMKNDGHGHLTEIPSMFISNSDGLKMSKIKQDCGADLILKIKFDIYQTEVANVTFWLDISNRESFILARDFYKNQYLRVLKDYANFSIKFRAQKGCPQLLCMKENCIGTISEQYCRNANNPSEFDMHIATGVQIIEEQLRSYFLYQKLKISSEQQIWWNYMIQFDANLCVEKKGIRDCSEEMMGKVGVSSSIIKEINSSIEATFKNITQNMPNILRSQHFDASEAGIYFYPEATINSKNFYGLFKAPEVFEMICQSLLKQPKECYTFVKNTDTIDVNDESSNIWPTVMMIIALMTAGFLITLMIYTKLIKKEVNQQLSVEVNKMVENYVTLAQKTSSTSVNKMEEMK